MNKIEIFSPTYAESIVQYNNNSIALPSGLEELQGFFCGQSTASTNYVCIKIMKGVVPTSLAGFESLSFRAEDELMRFATGIGRDPLGSQDFSVTYPSWHEAVVTSNVLPATASGTATWFLLQSMINPSTICHLAIGNIGLPGSGADMEFSGTAVIQGSSYHITRFYLNFSYLWSI